MNATTVPASAVAPDSAYFLQAHLPDGTPAVCDDVPPGCVRQLRRHVAHSTRPDPAVLFALWTPLSSLVDRSASRSTAVSAIVPALHLPRWVLTLVLAVILAGFPVAVVLAWGWGDSETVEPTEAGDGDEAPGRQAQEPASVLEDGKNVHVAFLTCLSLG